MTSSIPGIPQILSIINVNGVFLQSTLNLAESYSPEQIVDKFFKLKFQCKTYISKEKKSKDAPPPPPPKTMLNSHVIFSYILETNIAWGGVGWGQVEGRSTESYHVLLQPDCLAKSQLFLF